MIFEKAYGSWASNISATVVQKNSKEYLYLCQDQNRDAKNFNIYWIEERCEEGGRNVIMSRDIGRNESHNIEWTPLGFSAKTRVHEYGGADVFVYSGIVYFSNELDQQLYKQVLPKSEPSKISQNSNCRYANGFYSGNLDTIFIVREDHSNENDVINSIVTIREDKETVLIKGADFYSSPSVSESGKIICWIEWVFPNMPWDNTSVCVANIDQTNLSIDQHSKKVVLTGTDADPISCTLPTWTRDDLLCYISDESGYWNVWFNESPTNKINLTPFDEDIGDPMWSFDYRKYDYSRVRNELVVARKGGILEFINLDGTKRRITDFGDHISDMSHCQLLSDGSVVAFGFSSSTKMIIYHLYEDGKFEIIDRCQSMDDMDPKIFSLPRHIKYPVGNGFSYGYFYPPCNPQYCGPKGTIPPLLVQAHGGPTGATFINLNMEIQYWTSRGYAVLDVDYRGSTGYGKDYRHSLKGNWGVFDLMDCCAGARYLIKEGLVDESMIAIRGGSAGGYTTLCCLTFESVFKAGSSKYGIGDLKKLTENTHKFESRYMDILVGDMKEKEYLYKDRSPIHFPEKINCPVIFFQGDEDPIVPKEQSEEMFKLVKKKGLPCSLVIYEGEQHGFRKMENIIHCMESEYYFFAQMFGFDCADIKKAPIIIENFN